jgi:hypothetical protein
MKNVTITRTGLVMLGLFAAGLPSTAADYRSLDEAVASLVRAAEATPDVGRTEAAPVPRRTAPGTGAGPTAKGPDSAAAGKYDALFARFWGVDSSDGAIDLQFRQGSGSDEHGKGVLYARHFNPGARTVDDDATYSFDWKIDSAGESVVIDAGTTGTGKYRYPDKGVLKVISVTGAFPPDPLSNRAVGLNEMGNNGKKEFRK